MMAKTACTALRPLAPERRPEEPATSVTPEKADEERAPLALAGRALLPARNGTNLADWAELRTAWRVAGAWAVEKAMVAVCRRVELLDHGELASCCPGRETPPRSSTLGDTSYSLHPSHQRRSKQCAVEPPSGRSTGWIQQLSNNYFWLDI